MAGIADPILGTKFTSPLENSVKIVFRKSRRDFMTLAGGRASRRHHRYAPFTEPYPEAGSITSGQVIEPRWGTNPFY